MFIHIVSVSANKPTRVIDNKTVIKPSLINKPIIEVNHIPSILKVPKHSDAPSSDEEEE